MTTPDTDTLAGLLAECTPGPWEWAGTYRGDVHHLVYWVPGETFPNGDPRYIAIHSDGSAAGEYGPEIDVTGADARLIALAPELAAEVIALRAQAAKDKARIERLEAALRKNRAEMLRIGANLPIKAVNAIPMNLLRAWEAAENAALAALEDRE